RVRIFTLIGMRLLLVRALDRHLPAALDRQRLLHLIIQGGVAGLHKNLSAVFNGLDQIVLDLRLHILLGVHKQFLRSLLVLKAVFVGATPTRRGIALDGAFGLVIGQGIGHGLLRIVYCAGDERAVRVALDKADNDLLANAG